MCVVWRVWEHELAVIEVGLILRRTKRDQASQA